MNTQTQEEKNKIREQWEASGRTLPIEMRWPEYSEAFREDVDPDGYSGCVNSFEDDGIEVRIKPGHEPKSDPINSSHYDGTACLDAIKAQMSPEEYRGFLRGNVIKYIWRFDEKGGKADLAKAAEYLEWLREEWK